MILSIDLRGNIMGLWIIFASFFVLQCVFTPWFLKASWPNRSNKSLLLKMIAASLFVATGVLSMYISDNFSQFAFTMLAGLVFGWIGDFFLHSNSQKFFAIGFVSFLVGHLVYIAGYINALNTFKNYMQFNFIEVVIGVALLAIALISAKKFNMQFSMKLLKYAIAIYTVILITMFLKASSLGINYMLSGGENGVLAAIVLTLGALLFVASDGTIAILMFGGQKGNRPLKIFNIVTYFAGQMLLASSILFIKI